MFHNVFILNPAECTKFAQTTNVNLEARWECSHHLPLPQCSDTTFNNQLNCCSDICFWTDANLLINHQTYSLAATAKNNRKQIVFNSSPLIFICSHYLYFKSNNMVNICSQERTTPAWPPLIHSILFLFFTIPKLIQNVILHHFKKVVENVLVRWMATNVFGIRF